MSEALALMLLASCVSCGSSGGESSSKYLQDMHQGYATYAGDNTTFNAYDNSSFTASHTIEVRLFSDDIVVSGGVASGVGNVLVLGLNSSTSGSLDEGTYVGIDYDSEHDGWIKYGDLYMGMDASTVDGSYSYDQRGWLIDGFVTVTRSGAGYVFDIDLKDLYDFEVKGMVTVPELSMQ